MSISDLSNGVQNFCNCGRTKPNIINNDLFEVFVTQDFFDYPIKKDTKLCKLIKRIFPFCNHICLNLKTLDILVTNCIPENVTLGQLVDHIDNIGPLMYDEHNIICFRKVLTMKLIAKEEIEKFNSIKSVLIENLTLHDLPLMEFDFGKEFLDFHFKHMTAEEYLQYASYNNKEIIYDKIFNYIDEYYCGDRFPDKCTWERKTMFVNLLCAGNVDVCTYVDILFCKFRDTYKNYTDCITFAESSQYYINDPEILFSCMSISIRRNYFDLFMIFYNIMLSKGLNFPDRVVKEFKDFRESIINLRFDIRAKSEFLKVFFSSFMNILSIGSFIKLAPIYERRFGVYNATIKRYLIDLLKEEIYIEREFGFIIHKIRTFRFENMDCKEFCYFLIEHKKEFMKIFGENVFFGVSFNVNIDIRMYELIRD